MDRKTYSPEQLGQLEIYGPEGSAETPQLDALALHGQRWLQPQGRSGYSHVQVAAGFSRELSSLPQDYLIMNSTKTLLRVYNHCVYLWQS